MIFIPSPPAANKYKNDAIFNPSPSPSPPYPLYPYKNILNTYPFQSLSLIPQKLLCLQRRLYLIRAALYNQGIIDIKFISMVSAFSVPKATRDEKHSKNPGPGQYNPEHSPKHVKPSDPLYSFGKDVRKSEGNINPGPGAYEPKEHIVKDHKPAFSMLSRRNSQDNRLNVGPGQYSPEYTYGKDKSPAFSMRSKHDIGGEKLPGPGQYEYKSHIAVKERGHDFGKEARSRDEANRVPGPGSYEYENAVFKYGSKMEPSYGFGSRLMVNTDGRVPGPGAYQPKKEVYSHIGGIVGKDLRDSLVMSKTPGPGNYQHDINFKEKSPVWSLSKSSRDYGQGDKFNVGPGQYDHPNGYKKVTGTAPSYGFDGKSQKLKYDINEVPGPGSYERPLIKSRKSIKIAEKLKDLQGLKVPGPGSYEQFKYDNDSWAKGSGRYSIAKDSRLKESATFVPGPGAYENKSTVIKEHKGKVTFGRDDKLKYDLGKVPGPGQYDLKPTFADVPKYLLPSTN